MSLVGAIGVHGLHVVFRGRVKEKEEQRDPVLTRGKVIRLFLMVIN